MFLFLGYDHSSVTIVSSDGRKLDVLPFSRTYNAVTFFDVGLVQFSLHIELVDWLDLEEHTNNRGFLVRGQKKVEV